MLGVKLMFSERAARAFNHWASVPLKHLCIYFMWMGVLPTCISVDHMHIWCSWRWEENISWNYGWFHCWSYGWLTGTMWVLGTELGPLQEQSVHLAAEPQLQSLFFLLKQVHTQLSLVIICTSVSLTDCFSSHSPLWVFKLLLQCQ